MNEKIGKKDNAASAPRPKIMICENKECKPVEKKFPEYTLIEGFPGVGLIGTIAAKYLTERLGCREYGIIKSDFFLPIIRIHRGAPVYPARIYISERHKIIVLISEQMIPHKYMHTFTEEMVGWIKSKKITRVISLSGIKSESAEKGKVYGIAADRKSVKALEKHNVEIIEEGISTGITALMLLELKNTDIEAYSLLGGSVVQQPDYKASAEILSKLADILGIEIDVKPLYKEAKLLEKELLTHIQEVTKTQKQMMKKGEPRTPMYV